MCQNTHLKKREDSIIPTVEQLVQHLDGLNYLWAIVGGCNLYLRGCLQSTGDIDIVTNRNGAISIYNRLEKYAKEELFHSEVENVRSYFFQAFIDSCTIEVMGDPENKINDRWIQNADWILNIEHIFVRNMLLPVTTLNYEKNINQELNNWNRVKDIENCIKTHQTAKKPSNR